MERGAVVLLRGLHEGRVRWAFACNLVHDDGVVAVLSLRAGAPGKWIKRDSTGRYLHRWATAAPPDDHVWESTDVLWVEYFDKPWAIGLFWSAASGEFIGWYVNLQSPISRTKYGYDMTDHALDVWVPADGEPQVKDQADLEEAVRLGIFTTAEAEAIVANGAAVVRDPPWPTGWEGWQWRETSWVAPSRLPADWDAIEQP